MAVFVQGNTRDYATVAYAASGVIKATPGRLFRVFGYSSNAAAQWVQLYNSATVPADTSVPKVVIRVGITSNFDLDLGDLGLDFPTGIAWSTSTTGPTKTLGAADSWVVAIYK